MADYLAFDFGAESGRAVAGSLAGRRLRIREAHRFPNHLLTTEGRLHWDLDALFGNLLEGLQRHTAESGAPRSIGVDTWGVDFGLLDAAGKLLESPTAYRDDRTRGAMEYFFHKLPRRRIYERTGVQFLPFNTLFQLASLVRDGSPLLERARDLLFMPDLFHYRLTGERFSEFTFATTSQLYNPRDYEWDERLFQALAISREWMQDVVMPGTVIGNVREEWAAQTGCGPVPVVAVATHDTGSAIAAVPAQGEDWAYISSGTWSLMGVEAREPVIGDAAYEANLTNEGGVGGRFRVLKNITGLWLLQQCRRQWDPTRSYADLAAAAQTAAPFVSLVDPDDAAFLNPDDMPTAIVDFCVRTGQPAPVGEAAMTRCIFESLALKYRFVLEQLRAVTGHEVNRIHVIGGGCQNELLCQFTADATGLPVTAGPVEATAIGNLLVQAMAMGEVESLTELRRVVRESFEMREYAPREPAAWDEVWPRFRALAAGGE
ncbi:MAG: rhamnulokinase [Candidatus Lernaella stagnicola]|nr:rhamnulokinase [Candidatus Lernaella stagnicola]